MKCRGFYFQAIDLYTQVIRSNPNMASLYLNRAEAYYYNRQYNRAAEDIDIALQLTPEDPLVYVMRGKLKNWHDSKKTMPRKDFEKKPFHWDSRQKDIPPMLNEKITYKKTEYPLYKREMLRLRQNKNLNRYDVSCRVQRLLCRRPARFPVLFQAIYGLGVILLDTQARIVTHTEEILGFGKFLISRLAIPIKSLIGIFLYAFTFIKNRHRAQIGLRQALDGQPRKTNAWP